MRRIKSLIELPKKGKALIITDLHGNLEDFGKYMEIWEKFKGGENHLVLTGDYIHGMFAEEDNSIKILDSVKQHQENDRNFHVLLGNHEWSHIANEAVYKAGINQKLEFEMQVKEQFGSDWERKLDEYIDFFKKLPVAARTKNGVFISHAAPAKNIKDVNDIINITDNGYGMDNETLFEMLWNRYPDDYDEKDIDIFLEKTGCNVSVVGHTPVDGYKAVGRQVVFSSSFSAGKKLYLELDLEKEINDVQDIVDMLKPLW